MTEAIGVMIEGTTDQLILERILSVSGLRIGKSIITEGKVKFNKKIAGINESAKFEPWLILRDLDQDADCAVALVQDLLPVPSRLLSFRVAVHEAEAWLLADREAIAHYLGVSATKIPRDPEAELKPKRTIVNLARHSSESDIRDGIVPDDGSGRSVGTGYTTLIGDFIRDHWSPERAGASCPTGSLSRLLAACQRFAAGGDWRPADPAVP